MNRQIWISVLLLMLVTACSEEQPVTGIQFTDRKMQQTWERAQNSVLTAREADLNELPAMLHVWLALGHRQEAQQRIERMAEQLETLQPSDTLSRMAYSVSMFADNPEWAMRYANPIICKCAEYYRNGGQNADSASTARGARYCYELMVMTNNDGQGHYAQLLSDTRNWQSLMDDYDNSTEIWTQIVNMRPTCATEEAMMAQAVINCLVHDNNNQLEVVKCYPWKGNVSFNGIYSGLGVKVSGTVNDNHVDVVMEAWRDADFTMMGERFQMQKGQKTERSFIRQADTYLSENSKHNNAEL